VTLPALAVGYRADLEYRYEVAAIALTWVTPITGGPLAHPVVPPHGNASAGGSPPPLPRRRPPLPR
jgi:hypothetical protein